MEVNEREIELCQKGDTMYRVCKIGVDEITIVDVKHYPHSVYKDNRGNCYFNRNIGRTCFKTKEEAEKEFVRREKILEKRKLLKKYEEELNQRFGITNHFIIK